jgi:hypothetical protein
MHLEIHPVLSLEGVCPSSLSQHPACTRFDIAGHRKPLPFRIQAIWMSPLAHQHLSPSQDPCLLWRAVLLRHTLGHLQQFFHRPYLLSSFAPYKSCSTYALLKQPPRAPEWVYPVSYCGGACFDCTAMEMARLG